MELEKGHIQQLIKKFGAPALILLVGLGLMLLPSKDKKEIQNTVISDEPDHILTIEQQLSEILSAVDGAGEVRVLLTIASGEEIIYQSDTSSSTSADSSTNRIETITITDAQREQEGLIRQVNPPIYKGAIVVCKGADVPTVRLAIVDAISKITGLGADKISVLKMK